VVEHLPYKQRVTGSKPVPPRNQKPKRKDRDLKRFFNLFKSFVGIYLQRKEK